MKFPERERAVVARSPGPGFDAFWALYPRQEGMLDAERAWRRRAGEARAEEILRGLRRQLEHLRREDGRWAPLPARWIRGERWHDHVPRAAPSFLSPATAGNLDVARRFVERAADP